MGSRVAAVLDPKSSSSPLSVPAPETVVILADYQNYVVGMSRSTGASAVAVARSLREWAEEHGIPVIIAKVFDGQLAPPQSRFYERTAELVKMVEANPSLVEVDERLSKPGEPASVNQNIYYVTRRLGLVSALYSDGIDEILQRHKTRSLIVGGLATGGCVLSTVRDANDKGYITTVVKDACGDHTPELHDMLTSHILPATAHVLSLEELRDAWPKAL